MKVSILKLLEKNPRKILDEDLEKLKHSLKDDPDFLVERKILVNDTKDWFIVYWGNQRLKALIALWYDEIPDEWVSIKKITKKVMKKRIIIDNTEYWQNDDDILREEYTKDELEWYDLPEDEIDIDSIFDEKEYWNKEIDPDEIWNEDTVICPSCDFEFIPKKK